MGDQERIAAIRARVRDLGLGGWTPVTVVTDGDGRQRRHFCVEVASEFLEAYVYARRPSGNGAVGPWLSSLKEAFSADVPWLLAELETQAEVIRHLQDAALTLTAMRDEARAVAFEEAALIAEDAAEVYDGYATPGARRDARKRNLEMRDAAEYVAKRIREAASPRQPDGRTE